MELEQVPKLNEEYTPTTSNSLSRQQQVVQRQKWIEKELRRVLRKSHGKMAANNKWLIKGGLERETEV